MIGYYVHHRGAGHLHRAMAIAAELSDEVTILTSGPRPVDWTSGWVELPLDTDVAATEKTANGALHWVPLGSEGLRSRMAAISSWIEAERPRAMVVDVSVEVALLARLHGIPVITIAQPGDRTDAAHELGYRASTAIVAPWPASVSPLLASDLTRIEPVGAISRLAVGGSSARNDRRVAVLGGFGGRGESGLDVVVASAHEALPGYTFSVPRSPDTVQALLLESAFVIAHAGQNAVAEIAASRTPAVLVPEDRPHDEQRSLGRALASSAFPVRILDPDVAGETDWTAIVDDITGRDAAAWSGWCDGLGALRAARIIERVAL